MKFRIGDLVEYEEMGRIWRGKVVHIYPSGTAQVNSLGFPSFSTFKTPKDVHILTGRVDDSTYDYIIGKIKHCHKLLNTARVLMDIEPNDKFKIESD